MVKVVQNPTLPNTMPPDQDAHLGVESLDQIGGMGEALEVKDLPVGPDPSEAATAEIAAALELLRAAALPFAPDHVQAPLAMIWTDKQIERIAAAVVDLCEFHGWTVGEFFTQYGPYLQLLAALGMPILGTLKILKMPPPKQAEQAAQG